MIADDVSGPSSMGKRQCVSEEASGEDEALFVMNNGGGEAACDPRAPQLVLRFVCVVDIAGAECGRRSIEASMDGKGDSRMPLHPSGHRFLVKCPRDSLSCHANDRVVEQ